ncbi:MAG TPA: YceI family protein [Xanthomonadaceae bacterium]|nr:YceI family protein [Xanthomonadaceae bacterium]
MRTMPRWPLALLSALLPFAATAEPAGYSLDPVHTRVLFAVSHAGFSDALGTISGSRGQLWFDPDDWSSAKLAVTVPVARFDLGDPGWNRAVGKRSLLDVGAHPVATFVSSRIEPQGADKARVCGMLTLREVGREVCMDVVFHQLKRHPLPPFHRTAGFSATATLSRSAFGITTWPTVIGDAVQLRIEAEAVADAGVRAETIAPPALDNAQPPPEQAAPLPAPPSTRAQEDTPPAEAEPAPLPETP